MHILKKLAIGVAVVLALTSVAAGAASASQRSIAAGNYPAGLLGTPEGEVHFSTLHNGGVCEGSISGTLSSAMPTVAAGYSMTCTKSGIYRGALNANGCQFELNSDYNTVDIGPAGCGPMTMLQQTCTTYIFPQNGIPATYETAPTEGGASTLWISIETNKLKYRECNTSGEVREDGSISAKFRVRAASEGSATNLSLTKPEYINLLSAEKYPAPLISNAGKTGEANFTFGSAGTARCSASYSGQLSKVWEYAELVPSLTNCVMFGLKSTVNTNGCRFALSALTGNQFISCPEGKAVAFAWPAGNPCEASIGPQENLAGGKSENTTAPSGRSAVNLEYNMSSLAYTVTNDSSFVCPFEGVGAKSGATFASHSVLLEGQDSAGPIAIKKGA
jgi:hypothetical protein